MDQDHMKSLRVFDPVKKCHYQVLIPKNLKKASVENEDTSNEEEAIVEELPTSSLTIWNQTETLALINIFSLFKDKFKGFKKKKEQWILISEELAKIGINKIPEKCEIKWKNLLRVYRQHKIGNKGQGKFEFFNELDDIMSNDKQLKYIIQYKNSDSIKTKKPSSVESSNRNQNDLQLGTNKRSRCSCRKSDKQKRHEDRMAIMTKKMEIEDRKVKAFEEYLQFLKTSAKINKKPSYDNS